MTRRVQDYGLEKPTSRTTVRTYNVFNGPSEAMEAAKAPPNAVTGHVQ